MFTVDVKQQINKSTNQQHFTIHMILFASASDYNAFGIIKINPKTSTFLYWRKYVHEVLVNRLGGLSLPRKSVVRLTDRPDMTLDVYRGRKTTVQ